MAPIKRIQQAPTVEPHQKDLHAYFKRRRAGRPKKRGNLPTDDVEVERRTKRCRGPVPKKHTKKKASQKEKKMPASKAKEDILEAEEENKAKVRRQNWGSLENTEKLRAAVVEWDKKCARALNSNGEEVSLREFSVIIGVPYNTFKKYVGTNRRVIGKSVGRQPLIIKEDQQFIADVMARRDRGNDGATPAEAVDYIQEMNPQLSIMQSRKHLNRTLLKNHPLQLKSKPRKAQATTTKRSNINVTQQYRWYKTYESALDELRKRNVGVCNVTGKTFGELIHHFITGGDETCMMACEDGSVSVIGAAGRKKHEKTTNDSRVSITMYRTGSVAGDTGPTVFLLAGKYKRNGFTDDFLCKHGAAKGSTVIMTPTAFMTIDAWEACTPSVCYGLRSINKYVAANPQWYMLEVFDGFGAHVQSLTAMEQRLQHKILSLKEEGDTSHVNQAYDKYVARSDKKAKAEGLGMLRSAKFINKGVIDQWGLIHVGLFIARSTERETWTTSFDACNMDPRTRISFPLWCKRIECFLQGGESFKTETADDLDKYNLLPSFWHGMTPLDKKKIFDTVQKHNGYTIECCKELINTHHIHPNDLQSVRLCLECAADNPEHLDRGIPECSAVEEALANPEITSAQENIQKANESLNSFLLKPSGMKGLELFGHMINKRHISPSSKAVLSPSPYLDVEVTKANRTILNAATGHANTTKRAIMKDAVGDGAKMRMAARRLDMLGYIKAHCGLVNNEEKIKKLRNKLQLTNSVAEIEILNRGEEEEKKRKAMEELEIQAPAAKNKLSDNGGCVSKLYKKEICSILSFYFNVEADENKLKKDALVAMLDDEIGKKPNVLSVASNDDSPPNSIEAVSPTINLPNEYSE